MKGRCLGFILLLSGVDSALIYAQTPVTPSAIIKPQEQAPINLNTADASTLAHAFKGIGKKRAEAIVLYREEHGRFKSVSELAHIRGLGLSFVTRNLPQLDAVFVVE